MEYILFRLRNLPHTPVQKYFLSNAASLDEEWYLLETHRAVLKMTSKPLSDAVLEPHSDIDATDAYGRTAVWWAAFLDDTESVKTLLEHGADPNIKDDVLGMNVFHCAAVTGQSFHTWEALLKYGADVTAVSRRHQTILHLIMYRLGRSFVWGNGCHHELLRFMEHCLDLGHPLDLQDWLGDTILSKAVQNSSHHVVAFLLDRGVDYTISDNCGNGLLHSAASKADATTMNVLAAHGLSRIDISLNNRCGQTALDLFRSCKGGRTPEEIKAFYYMWNEVSSKARLPDLGESVPGIAVMPDGEEESATAEQQEDRQVEDAIELDNEADD
ncbi:hypothetical protein BFW01_g4457 [Lasiodiplodia theobromae]|nr:hypothetical protein BFW01_g4457 [Lasiodiplodia theobromae]